MSDTHGSVSALGQGTPAERFARGWHCLGLARVFQDGRAHGIAVFGGRDAHGGGPRMAAGIADAVRDGAVPIGAQDGY